MARATISRRRTIGMALAAGIPGRECDRIEQTGTPQVARPPALQADLVRAFVGVAHGDFGEVQRLMEVTPTLLTPPGIGVAETLRPHRRCWTHGTARTRSSCWRAELAWTCTSRRCWGDWIWSKGSWRPTRSR